VQLRVLQIRTDMQTFLDDFVLPATVVPNVVQAGRTLKTTAEHLSAALLLLDQAAR
jgi:hypothetical protein